MVIRAGRLNRKVGIYQTTETVDSITGQPVKGMTLRSYAWASVRGLSGAERAEHLREEMGTISHIFEIRYSGEVSVTDKIHFNGYYWDIQSINPRGRLNRETIEIVAQVLEYGAIEGGS